MGKWYASTEPLNEKYKAMNEIQANRVLILLLRIKQERVNVINNVINRTLQRKIRKIW